MLPLDAFLQISSPLFVGAVSFSILGMLYLACGMSNRQSKLLHRLVWLLSSWFLLTCVLIISFALLTNFYAEYFHQIIWRLVGILSFGELMSLSLLSSRVSVDLPFFDWKGLGAAIAFMGFELIGVGIIMFDAPIVTLLFVALNLATTGALFFCASKIQWWLRKTSKGKIEFYWDFAHFIRLHITNYAPIFEFINIVLSLFGVLN